MHDIVRAQWPVRLPVVRADGVADGRGRAAVARMRRAVQGINFDRGELTIRDGKDGKDRVTMLRSAIAQSAFLRPALNLPNARTVGVLAPWNAHEPVGFATQARLPPRRGLGRTRLPSEGGASLAGRGSTPLAMPAIEERTICWGDRIKVLAHDFFEEVPAVPCPDRPQDL